VVPGKAFAASNRPLRGSATSDVFVPTLAGQVTLGGGPIPSPARHDGARLPDWAESPCRGRARPCSRRNGGRTGGVWPLEPPLHPIARMTAVEASQLPSSRSRNGLGERTSPHIRNEDTGQARISPSEGLMLPRWILRLLGSSAVAASRPSIVPSGSPVEGGPNSFRLR
jgi:hypothetical protein